MMSTNIYIYVMIILYRYEEVIAAHLNKMEVAVEEHRYDQGGKKRFEDQVHEKESERPLVGIVSLEDD